MKLGRLDEKFINSLTSENIQSIFNSLKRSKTDIVPRYKTIETSDDSGKIIKKSQQLDPIRIARGCDGVCHVRFQGKIEDNARAICEDGKSGNYVFKPFMEIETAKPPFGKGPDELAKARKAGKIRPISISTIRDTVFQKLIADTLSKGKNGFAEMKFKNAIDFNSYGYRDGKSSKMAVTHIQEHITNGYVHILDGDIEKFFDTINHNLLEKKMKSFFGAENTLIQKYLRKFIKVRKIPPGGLDFYKEDKKRNFQHRNIGIPQGGVLSGLLANVFLFDFDLYVVNELMSKYGFKYLRYADDFVLMFKDNADIVHVFNLLESYLDKEGLKLHPLPPTHPLPGEKYSKKVDVGEVEKGSLDFLGFEITPTHLRVKGDNYKKFQKRIRKTLDDIKVNSIGPAYFYHVADGINKKITALEDDIEDDFYCNGGEKGVCPHCKKLIPKRSWIGYFMMTNDVRQLRNIDTMIRREIYRNHSIKTHGKLLSDENFKEISKQLNSVLSTYYRYKKQLRKHSKSGFCQNKSRYYNPATDKIATYPPCENVKI